MTVPCWILVVLTFYTFLSNTSAFTIQHLADGKSVRVPSQKPYRPYNVTNLIISRSEHQLKPKPKSKPSGAPPKNPNAQDQATLHGTMCGLDVPSAENWDANQEDIIEWAQVQHDAFVSNGKTDDNFPRSLREAWAPNSLDSALFCDTIGSCSISTCLSLVEDDGQNHHDRQMALYVFEWISNVDHAYTMLDKLLGDTMDNVLHSTDRIINEFSSGPRIEKALKEELKKAQLLEKIFTAVGLSASGVIGLSAFPGLAASTNLAVSLYVGITSIMSTFRQDPDFVDDLKETFHSDLNDVYQVVKRGVSYDWNDLMRASDVKNRTIVDVMQQHGYLGSDKDLYINMAEHLGRVIMGSVINKQWEFDRSYLVMVNSIQSCEADKILYPRGPIEYLVCLPELPQYGFWLYSIDHYHENDPFHDDEAMVRGPTGFWKLNGTTKYYGINLQDVVRSSLWVHEKDLVKKKDERIEFDPMDIYKLIEENRGKEMPDGGRMAGVFTLPILRNPLGESISGVLDKHGQNYPCMSGDFAWNSGTWSMEKDQTTKFLMQSGFMYSEDWHDACHGHNRCYEDRSFDLKAALNRVRGPNDPEIPKRMRHLFRMCTHRRDSLSHPGWPGRDKNQ